MPSSKRSEQLGKALKKVINNIIYKKINDPRIKFVTLTKIQVSSDLKYAKIYITILGDENHKKKCLKGLKNATNFIRGEIGRELEIRYVPEIHFIIDKEMEYQYKILNIVSEINREQLDKKNKNDK
jgi:ribosome-binding factor A